MGLLDSIVKAGKAVGTHLQRKANQQKNNYMALERAQEFLEKQQTTPQRAPLNVSKKEFSEEHIAARKKAVEEKLKKSEEMLSHLQHVKVFSTDPSEGSLEESKSPEVKASKLPVMRGRHPPPNFDSQDMPRGLVDMQTLIDILQNHGTDPNQWTPPVLAERFKLRESDLENLFKYYSLLKPEDFKGKKNLDQIYLES